MNTDRKKLVEKEVIDFHLRIESWFRGSVANKDSALAEILGSFHPLFSMTGANGNNLSCNDLANWLPTVFGAFPDKEIVLSDMVISFTRRHGLVEYTESQTSDGKVTERRSSAIFIFVEQRAQWYHLLEEWI